MNKIIFDIETTGLNPTKGDKITCICAKEMYSEHSYKFCSVNESRIIEGFLLWLYKYNITDSVLISGNGKKFDIPFIINRWLYNRLLKLDFIEQGDKVLESFDRLNKYKHIDLVSDFTSKYISLNDLANLLSLPTKSANGLQAIKWFEEKQYDKIEKYCWDDVLLTEQIYFTLEKINHISCGNINDEIFKNKK